MAEMEGPAMAPNRGNEDWRSIAEETSKEMDPAKLTILVGKLCRALDKRMTESLRCSTASPPIEPRTL